MSLAPHTAGTTADPYPYYARLRAEGPLTLHAESGLLVATTLAAVRAVLAAGTARTRPADAPVPPVIADTPAGRVFGRLVRMTDGVTQGEAKAAIVRALSGVSPESLGRAARDEAAALLASGPVGPTALGFEVPVRVMAGALGFTGDERAVARDLIAEFVACISPLSGPDQIAVAITAADRLDVMVARLIDARMPGLALAVADEMAPRLPDDPILRVANTIGLMSQTYDATGALVSLALVSLAREPDGRALFAADPIAYLREVARYDAPIQNTRRFFHAPAEILGTPVAAGTAVLLLLASANRDPAGNPDPDRFDPARPAPVLTTFSEGAHRCPGEELALHLAAGTVTALLAAGFDPEAIPLGELVYAPSANARIAMIG
jgi:cytochrome P450